LSTWPAGVPVCRPEDDSMNASCSMGGTLRQRSMRLAARKRRAARLVALVCLQSANQRPAYLPQRTE
jgi:hypothetical protein